MKWKKRLVKVTKLCVKDLIFQWNVFRWQFTSRFMANEGISLMKLLFFVLMLWLCFCILTEGSSPMSTRNFPPSFWDSNYVPPIPAHPQVSPPWISLRFSIKNASFFQVPDLYSTDGGYSTDPWVPHAAAAHYGSYAHAAHAAHAYHHNMAQYGSLLRLPQQYGHSSR